MSDRMPLRALRRARTRRPSRPTRPTPPDAIPLLVRVPDAGALKLSIAAGSTLVLTDQEPDDGILHLSGELPTVTVLDDRNGPNRGGWSVSGLFTPLSVAASPDSTTHTDHAAPTLSADGIGWLPRLMTSGSGLVAGPEVASRPAGGAGLADPAVLARASAEHRDHATELGAAVVLDAPADAAPGSYRGTVTLTLFPVE